MGALTSLTKWIPEDDLLLKNAVEEGASLESLAKGAVPFSRRYTIRELQDRWFSLLYDLDTSTEASAKIVDIEMELTPSNLQKPNRPCTSNSKGNESSSRRRKADSVRSHYYAMRKRIRSEPCSADFTFLVPPALLAVGACDGDKDQFQPQSKHEVPFSNDYGHPEKGYDSMPRAFPELMRADSITVNGNVPHQSYHAGHVGSVEDVITGEISCGGSLFGHTEQISSAPLEEAECNNGNQSFEHNFQQRDFPHILGENLISVDTCSDVCEISQPSALGTRSPYEKDNSVAKPLTGFESSNNNCDGICSDFVGNSNLSLHVPDCSGSFHQLGYSSPPPDMPIWRTMEDISTPTMPMDGHYGDKGQQLLNLDDNKKIEAPRGDVASSEAKLDDRMYGAGVHNPTIIPENDFMDFSDTYMDFADDEDLLFIDGNEKDNTDRSCLGQSSILLNSPNDTHHADLETTNMLKTCLDIPDAAYSGVSNVLSHQMHSGPYKDHVSSVSGVSIPSTFSKTSDTDPPQEFSGVSMPSTSAKTPTTANPTQEFMICVLNTEDPEIPDNDHVILPGQTLQSCSSNLEQRTRESTGLISYSNVLSTSGKNPAGDLNKVKEQTATVQPTLSSLKAGSSSFPKAGMLHSCDGRAVEAKSSKGSFIAGVSSYASTGVDQQKSNKSEIVAVSTTPTAALKEESIALNFENQDNADTSFASFLENHLEEADDAKLNPLNVTNSSTQEANVQVLLQTCLPPHSDLVSAEIISASDQEEQFSDSEDGVPYTSDIEAMILDMDLSPHNPESSLFSKEVSRFQHIDTKKTIRWEQGFHSHINRAISCHGAYAVFYGRHLKYFIKDPEVSIGRETADAKVDIDVGREGRANKISRRQAIIKMDEEGAFSLKNIGRFSIFVNGKEVSSKKRVNLPSHSLVKIQDMIFTFDVNESAVRRCSQKAGRRSQEQSTSKFAWKCEQDS